MEVIPKLGEEEILPNSFHKANITFIQYPGNQASLFPHHRIKGKTGEQKHSDQ